MFVQWSKFKHPILLKGTFSVLLSLAVWGNVDFFFENDFFDSVITFLNTVGFSFFNIVL
jgi:hypothetical protein